MTALEAHLLCVGLVAADLVARAWRIQWIVRGLGHRVTFREAFVLNAFGDAACAITPLRLGGEPARLAGMLRSRVPATAAFVAISLEVLAAWPVVLITAGWLAWRYAPAWWASAGSRIAAGAGSAWPWIAAVVLVSVLAWRYAPAWWASAGSRLAAGAGSVWPWIAAVVLVSVLAWRYTRRVASPATHQVRRPIRRVLVYWRRMPRWPLVASIPLSFVNLTTRVAILPVLALTLPSPPALGPMALGSFALLYSQLVLPTPSGAGAVELGFLGGAAGDLGPGEAWLLLAWRFYTSGVGVLLGVLLAIQIYGWPTVQTAVARKR